MKIRIILIFLLLCTSRGVFAEETVHITTGEWPPWISEKLNHYGVISQIITDAYKSEGITVEFKFFPWKRAYFMARQGKADATAIWFYSRERNKDFFYSDPVVDANDSFFYLKSNPFEWKSLDDLKGLRIGGILGYTYTEEFYAAEKAKKIQVVWSATEKTCLERLLKGQNHIVAMDVQVANHLLRTSFSPEEAALVTHHEKPLRKGPVSLLFPRKNEKESKRLLKIFNRGLGRLKKSGKYD